MNNIIIVDKDIDPFYEKCYHELIAILDNAKICKIINTNKELAESFCKQIELINKTKLPYDLIDGLRLKFESIYENEFMIDYNPSFTTEEELLFNIKNIQKQIRSLIYSKTFINVSSLVNQDNDMIINPEDLNTNEEPTEVSIEDQVDDSNLTPEEERIIKLRKMSIKDKFIYMKGLKWFTKIRLEHINLYMVIRKKDYVASREKVLLRKFLNFYNQELNTNLTEASITKEFERWYKKYVVGFSYSWAVRIWMFIVGIPIMLVIVIAIIVVTVVKPDSGSNPGDVAQSAIELLKNIIR